MTYEEWGIQYEADPAHGELVIESLGLEGAKSVATPGAAEASEIGSAELSARRKEATTEGIRADAQEEESEPLSETRAHEYLSVGARMNYLAMDRMDIQFAAKEILRQVSRPNDADWTNLKRAARYLIGAPRLVAKYRWEALSDELTVYTDSNHAGCHRTRQSTTGGIITWGNQFVKSWSKTVAILCLSSGESELAAVVPRPRPWG